MKKTLLYLFILFAFTANSQTFEWLKSQPITFNSNPDMVSYVTACDPIGNTYTTGFKQNPFNYENIHGDLFYNKYNSAGELQFSKTFAGHGTVFSAVSDTDGNILLSIEYVGEIAIDAVSIVTVEQGVQTLLVKLDTNGNLIWYQPIEIDNSYECRMHAIATDSQNNIYLGIYDFQHSYIRKLSPEGDLVFTIPQLHVRCVTSLSVDNEENIYAAGSCADPGASYAGVEMPTPFFYNTYLAKYSPAGVYQWVKYVDDITCPNAQVVAVTPDQVYFSSYLFSNFAFDGIETEGPFTMFSDVFIAKLNNEGTFQWVREVPGVGYLDPASRKSLAADVHGNVFFAGSTRGNINWTNEIATTTGEGFNNDAIILKYNPEGEMLMAKTAGGAYSDRIDAITLNANGDILVSGMCTGTASFDNFTIAEEQNQSWPFLAKLMQNALGLTEQQVENLTFYPNPSADFIHISSSKTISGSIYNMLGQKIMPFVTNHHNPIDVRNLSKGTYLIKPDQSKSVKFIRN